MSENAWIEHDGKGCPVDTSRLVDIRFGPGARGKRYDDKLRQDPLNWEWRNGFAPLDIIAYRLSGPSA